MTKRTIKPVDQAAELSAIVAQDASLPGTLGAAIDARYELKIKKTEAERVVKGIQEEINVLEDHIFTLLRDNKMSGGQGKLAKVSISESRIPVVEDWAALYKHILENKEFDLLNKALAVNAVRERWENAEEVPGTGVFVKTKLSLTKV